VYLAWSSRGPGVYPRCTRGRAWAGPGRARPPGGGGRLTVSTSTCEAGQGPGTPAPCGRATLVQALARGRRDGGMAARSADGKVGCLRRVLARERYCPARPAGARSAGRLDNRHKGAATCRYGLSAHAPTVHRQPACLGSDGPSRGNGPKAGTGRSAEMADRLLGFANLWPCRTASHCLFLYGYPSTAESPAGSGRPGHGGIKPSVALPDSITWMHVKPFSIARPRCAGTLSHGLPSVVTSGFGGRSWPLSVPAGPCPPDSARACGQVSAAPRGGRRRARQRGKGGRLRRKGAGWTVAIRWRWVADCVKIGEGMREFETEGH
jgi:hypothetical protein